MSIAALGAACQTLPPSEVAAGAESANKQGAVARVARSPRDPRASEHRASAETAVAESDNLWERVRGGLSWQETEAPAVEHARARYLRQSDQYLPMISERAGLYLHYIVGEVESRGLPMELALLPMVESTLDPFATSAYRAAGLWQIMPATGKHLGLEQDWWFDGRRDLRQSTDAALDYLEQLHADLGEDWFLALAAYNAGKGRVLRAMADNRRRGKSTDYWSLSLPRETRKFVPRLLALTQIIADPAYYDVELPAVDNAPAFAVVPTGGQIEMARAAALAGVDLPTLRALNPGQLRWATSPTAPQELLLPPESAADFAGGVASLSPAERVQWQHYRIRRGDSLIRIARRFGTEVGTLRVANNLKGNFIRAGDTLLIPYGADSVALAQSGQEGLSRKGYRVRRGDSLYRIAGKFKVSIDDIVSWNSLQPGDYLHPGQQLTLYLDEG